MTLPWPAVTSSTCASIAQMTKMAKPIATDTMIRREPVSGSRCLEPEERKGRVAMSGARLLARRQLDRLGRFRRLLPVGSRLGRRAGFRRHGDIQRPALG